MADLIEKVINKMFDKVEKNLCTPKGVLNSINAYYTTGSMLGDMLPDPSGSRKGMKGTPSKQIVSDLEKYINHGGINKFFDDYYKQIPGGDKYVDLVVKRSEQLIMNYRASYNRFGNADLEQYVEKARPYLDTIIDKTENLAADKIANPGKYKARAKALWWTSVAGGVGLAALPPVGFWWNVGGFIVGGNVTGRIGRTLFKEELGIAPRTHKENYHIKKAMREALRKI